MDVHLTASLFSLVPQGAYAYHGSHIHFVEGRKQIYVLDTDWIDEFESLLSRLYWSCAEVVVTWSQERYAWSSDYSPGSRDDKPNAVVGRARFESARHLKEVAWNP